MTSKLQDEVVWCRRKKRFVQISFKKGGYWFNPDYLIESCPALADAGETCDQACSKQIGLPASMKRLQRQAIVE